MGQPDQDILQDVIQAKIMDIIDRITPLVDSYCDQYGFENPASITPQQYNGLLMYINFNLFQLDKSLLHKYSQGISNDHRITDMYDDDVVSGLCEYYVYLCSVYNKIPSIYGFALFSGVNRESISRWSSMESQRPRAYGIYKMLQSAYENGLENGAQSGKNPVGFIATLNHRFGWSQESRPSLTVNINRSQSEIMSTYNQNLLDDQQAKPSETP